MTTDTTVETYTCRACGEDKPVTPEYWYFFNGRRHQAKCKLCQRQYNRENYDPERNRRSRQRRREREPDHRQWQHLKYYHGISRDEWEAMYEAQNGQCAICGTEEPGGPGNRLAVDHDHETGEVRGLLCHRCNLALGYLRDDVTLLPRIEAYLGGR